MANTGVPTVLAKINDIIKDWFNAHVHSIPEPSDPTKIQDADGDTRWEVEKNADEDKIRGTVKDVEAFLIHDDGILDLAKQPRCRAYPVSPAQGIPTAKTIKVQLTGESYDNQNEFDSTVLSGSATATTANHLIDTTKNQFTAADVGKKVWNTTDHTYATVTAYNSASDLTLDTNIMANGEGYNLYHSRFTAKKAGTYSLAAAIKMTSPVADKRLYIYIYKNGGLLTGSSTHTSHIGTISVIIADHAELAANDFIELYMYHTYGVTKDIYGFSHSTFMAIHKLS